MCDYLTKSRKYKGFHYSVLEERMVTYLHNRTLKMLKAVIDLFDANHIQYMICGGTLLGGVTSGSFIPWDDDIDMCVLEEDYLRMIDILEHNLPEGMELQWYNTEPNYYHAWAKVRDKFSHVYPDIKSYKNNGVWVDLYPLKHMQRKRIQYAVAEEHFRYLQRRKSVGDISEDEMLRRIEENDLMKRMKQEEQRMMQSDDESYAYVIWSASKIVIEEKNCLPTRSYVFEGMQLNSFYDADQYLRCHYGEDYAVFPPEDLRRVGINYIEYME